MDSTTVLTLPVPEQIFWGFFGLAALALAAALVVGALPKETGPGRTAADLRAKFGLGAVPMPLLAIGALLWVGLFLTLVAALFSLIFEVWLLRAGNAEWRLTIVKLTALTTVLGAVVVLPITLNRMRLQREANDTTQEALFNEKIKAATEDLYARRQRSLPESDRDVWEDDITRRNAAIDRLYGLVDESPREAERVSRLLSVYVRELSGKEECPAEDAPVTEDVNQIKAWGNGLSARSDMENAVQVLGRLRADDPPYTDKVRIDLRGANLQGMSFDEGDFNKALLQKAQLQGANLGGAQLQEADLKWAQLQGAYLGWAQLQGANLIGAQLQGADLKCAQLQGAYLGGAQLQGAGLGGAQLQGADLIKAQLQGAGLGGAQLQGADLRWAQLQGANLIEAQLLGADLRWAQLQGAHLGGAQLQGTDLTGAQLQGRSCRGLTS